MGRAVSYDHNTQLCPIQFLEESYCGFKWPVSEETVQTVAMQFVLHGLNNLIGNLPITIDGKDKKKIIKLYKSWKKQIIN